MMYDLLSSFDVTFKRFLKTVKGWLKKTSMKRHGETREALSNDFDMFIIGRVQDLIQSCLCLRLKKENRNRALILV